MKSWGLKIILFIWTLSTPAFADVINKVLISGYGGQHDLDVRDSFYAGYRSYNSTEYLGEVLIYSQNILSSFIYAEQNGYEMIIRSTTGLTTGISFADDYPTVNLFMPAGSNDFNYVYSGEIENCPVVVTGAGVDSNVTGYSLEFYSIDPITGYNYSSYSNGYVAGELAFISNTLNIELDSARTLARMHSSEGGTLDPFSGFGKINVEEIINSVLPVELSLFEAVLIANNVHLNWRTETEVNNFGFEIQRRDLLADSSSQNFEKIGFINGYGNSNSPKQYSFIDDRILPQKKYSYRLKQIDNDGSFEYSNEIRIELITPAEFILDQNYPNPFNPTTKITFSLPKDSKVNLTVYNILGEIVIEIINEEKKSGYYEYYFDGSSLASGTYIYKIQAEEFSSVKKMLLLK